MRGHIGPQMLKHVLAPILISACLMAPARAQDAAAPFDFFNGIDHFPVGLFIDTGPNAIVNAGLMEATSGGLLTLANRILEQRAKARETATTTATGAGHAP